jgi:hypothetical protein
VGGSLYRIPTVCSEQQNSRGRVSHTCLHVCFVKATTDTPRQITRLEVPRLVSFKENVPIQFGMYLYLHAAQPNHDDITHIDGLLYVCNVRNVNLHLCNISRVHTCIRPYHYYVTCRSCLLSKTIDTLSCPKTRRQRCSLSQPTPSYYSSVSNPQKNADFPFQVQYPRTTTPSLPHISATGPHVINFPPTAPGLDLIHATAPRHAAPEIRRRARVSPRRTGVVVVVVGAAVEV